MDTLPPDFVYLRDVAPTIKQDIRFAGSNNFVGRPIPGYNAAECIVSKALADALIKVQQELEKRFNYSLLVYDCYRPAQAAEFFVKWVIDLKDTKNKSTYYPNIDKKDFMRLGFITKSAENSSGNSVDLTIVDNKTLQPISMGTEFDYLDPLSAPDNKAVGKVAYDNRQLLKNIMEKYGFKGSKLGWWYFVLQQTPYTNQYFNFTIEPRKNTVQPKK